MRALPLISSWLVLSIVIFGSGFALKDFQLTSAKGFNVVGAEVYYYAGEDEAHLLLEGVGDVKTTVFHHPGLEDVPEGYLNMAEASALSKVPEGGEVKAIYIILERSIEYWVGSGYPVLYGGEILIEVTNDKGYYDQFINSMPTAFIPRDLASSQTTFTATLLREDPYRLSQPYVGIYVKNHLYIHAEVEGIIYEPCQPFKELSSLMINGGALSAVIAFIAGLVLGLGARRRAKKILEEALPF